MGKQHAILVGLQSVDSSKYNGWDGRNGCWGCELDVDNLESILQTAGYEVVSLKTKDATRDAILSELKRTSKDLKSGDTLVFYFSGHGGQQPDQDGDESDGQDETLVAYDEQVIDDELNKIWIKFKVGVRIIMISDSCNSGTNYRNIRTVSSATPVKPIEGETSERMRAQMIHMGGCRDGFTSSGYMTGGKFTMALCEIWDGGSFNGTYRDFHQSIANKVSGQLIQYNEYGRVEDSFRLQRPFASAEANIESDASNVQPLETSGPKLAFSANGRLIGPRFVGARNPEGARTAGGIVLKQNGLSAIVNSALGSKLLPNATVRYGDGTYYAPTVSEMKFLLSSSQSDRRTWTQERFDCDDFSYVLKGEAAVHSYESADFKFGMCLGIIWANFSWVNGYHAVNWFVDSQKKLYLIEPQTDQIFGADDCTDSIGLIVV